jgi:8-hydroxy-5-deazaflavin:NADPH oxidoreductase
MRVGILGSGLMGGKLGTIFSRAGHEVIFSYAQSQHKLKKLARDAGTKARAGTPREAAQEAKVLLLAVHWSRVDDVLKQAGDLSGKVIVTCSLPMDAGNAELIIGTTTSGAEELAKKVPRAHVVCAFNTVPSEVLFGVYEARARPLEPALCTAEMIQEAKQLPLN